MFIDTHAHYDSEKFSSDRDALLTLLPGEGIEAVIDKDLASALLAEEIGADVLLILTGVEKVAVDYGKPTQRDIDRMTAAEARALMAEGQFPPGSMGPKIDAVCGFVEQSGGDAIITSLDRMKDAVEGRTGTRVTAN